MTAWQCHRLTTSELCLPCYHSDPLSAKIERSCQVCATTYCCSKEGPQKRAKHANEKKGKKDHVIQFVNLYIRPVTPTFFPSISFFPFYHSAVFPFVVSVVSLVVVIVLFVVVVVLIPFVVIVIVHFVIVIPFVVVVPLLLLFPCYFHLCHSLTLLAMSPLLLLFHVLTGMLLLYVNYCSTCHVSLPAPLAPDLCC